MGRSAALAALLALLLCRQCTCVEELEALPPHLTQQQQLEIALARAALAEAMARPPMEAVAIDAAGGAGAAEPHAQEHTADLLMGAISGDQVLVESSLAQGARLSDADAYGRAPLALAAMNGRVELVRELLRLGASLEARDASGHTAGELTALLRAESLEEGDAPRAAQLARVAEALAAAPPRAQSS